MKCSSVGVLFVFIVQCAFAQATEQSAADVAAFCKYISEKNKAKITALKAPEAVIRLANGDINNNFQKLAIAALSKDLSDLNKSRYVEKLIKEECLYYRLNQEAKLQVEYALIAAKNEALQYKLRQIKSAKQQVRILLKKIKDKVDKHNDTMHSYYEMDSSLRKLDDVERQIYVDLVAQHTPKIPAIHLQKLLNELRNAQYQRQQTLNNLNKNDNWSMQLQAGAQRNWPTNGSQNIQPYFALLVRYNLGSISTAKQMNHSLDTYMQWQNQQVLGTQNKLVNLLRVLKQLKAVEEERLDHLKENYQKYHALSKQINDGNSLDAQHFKQQIDIDRLLMDIEIKYINYSLMQMRRMVS